MHRVHLLLSLGSSLSSPVRPLIFPPFLLSSMSAPAVASARVSQLVGHLTAAGSSSSGASKPKVSIVARQNGVAVIQIANPPANQLSPEVQAGIGACYQEACADATIKAVVITGDKAFFMAGADIQNVHKMQYMKGITAADVRKTVAEGNRIFNQLESGPKPCVAAVNGTALGGGCELAMACNARICTPNAVFGQPELNLGIIPGLGGSTSTHARTPPRTHPKESDERSRVANDLFILSLSLPSLPVCSSFLSCSPALPSSDRPADGRPGDDDGEEHQGEGRAEARPRRCHRQAGGAHAGRRQAGARHRERQGAASPGVQDD